MHLTADKQLTFAFLDGWNWGNNARDAKDETQTSSHISVTDFAKVAINEEQQGLGPFENKYLIQSSQFYAITVAKIKFDDRELGTTVGEYPLERPGPCLHLVEIRKKSGVWTTIHTHRHAWQLLAPHCLHNIAKNRRHYETKRLKTHNSWNTLPANFLPLCCNSCIWAFLETNKPADKLVFDLDVLENVCGQSSDWRSLLWLNFDVEKHFCQNWTQNDVCCIDDTGVPDMYCTGCTPNKWDKQIGQTRGKDITRCVKQDEMSSLISPIFFSCFIGVGATKLEKKHWMCKVWMSESQNALPTFGLQMIFFHLVGMLWAWTTFDVGIIDC